MTRFLIILILVIYPLAHSFSQSEKPHPGPRSAEQATFLFQEASTAQKEGKIPLAIEDYQKILFTYPQFSEKLTVYQELMNLFLLQKNYSKVLSLGEEALLQHSPTTTYNSIQLMRAEAQLQSSKALQTKVIMEELLKTKPDEKTLSSALLYKAEALSQLGKNKEAFASLDAAKNNEKHADIELKIRARACGSKHREKKEDLLDYFHEKNMCFKETAALAKTYPTKDSAQVWCDRFHDFEDELKKAKTDSFTHDKIKKELDDTKGLSATWGCT